ncbi:YybH family protein [Flammeovirga kamogawensis]|uniref:Nuclear transport factor 2 family protein n=1 Tax=Flammeovirga kamogawensis TaxID=373891 RepID=A0ABX8GQM6_9BACT|nr:nuclear transport factor 2 family protein [Flammeovirga kamogawensis]MBB6462140.1 uncharacterized protein (TIGR02246 family) [Flammeovirga kamogawensis]QWG05874.1 nuclear transport factor 2 family protein [Flammeovirga kamogawensis]TRX67698.1 nuclear transport factor 2 family protein [Flammeovirga kamogawensis]
MEIIKSLFITVTFIIMSQTTIIADNTKPSANEKTAVTKLLKDYEKALNAGDTPTIVTLYTKEGIFYPTTFPTATGSEQLSIAYDNVFKMIQLTVEFDIEEVVIRDDYAFARTQSKGKTLIHANGQIVEEANRELFILKKVDGEWKIDRYMFNKSK